MIGISLGITNISLSSSGLKADLDPYVTYWDDGSVSGAEFSGSNALTDQPDSQGGSNAILWSNSGGGVGEESVVVKTSSNLVMAVGSNTVSCRFKSISSAGGKHWLRMRPLNTSVADIVAFDITDDSTDDNSRVGIVSNWIDVSVVKSVDGWVTFTGTINLSGDVTGLLSINMGTSNGDSNIPNIIADSFQVALHRMEIAAG